MYHFVHGSVRCKLKEERRKRNNENYCLFGLVESGQLSKWLTLSRDIWILLCSICVQLHVSVPWKPGVGLTWFNTRKNGGFFVTTRKNMEKMEDFSEENSQRFYEVIHDMP